MHCVFFLIVFWNSLLLIPWKYVLSGWKDTFGSTAAPTVLFLMALFCPVCLHSLEGSLALWEGVWRSTLGRNSPPSSWGRGEGAKTAAGRWSTRSACWSWPAPAPGSSTCTRFTKRPARWCYCWSSGLTPSLISSDITCCMSVDLVEWYLYMDMSISTTVLHWHY